MGGARGDRQCMQKRPENGRWNGWEEEKKSLLIHPHSKIRIQSIYGNKSHTKYMLNEGKIVLLRASS